MKEVERTIHLYRKVDVNESMEERHEKVMEGLSKLEAPLGLKDSEIPETPDFGTELVCFYDAKNIKTKGVLIEGVFLCAEAFGYVSQFDMVCAHECFLVWIGFQTTLGSSERAFFVWGRLKKGRGISDDVCYGLMFLTIACIAGCTVIAAQKRRML